MSELAEPKIAWTPFTPRGVAAFARASLERLIIVQSIFALAAAAAIVWLLASGFFPTLDAAASHLPATGDITNGKLNWPDASPKILADGHFISASVDLSHSGQLRLPAQFQFEFGEHSLLIISLLGEMELPYPPGQSFYFDRADVQPAWRAWAPDLLGLAAIGTFFGLLLIWAFLATVYFFPVWLVGFYADRDLNFRASWKVCGASILPGALLMTVSILLYGCGVFDLVKLCFAFVMHMVVVWIYLFTSPFFLRRANPAEKKNPFVPSKN